MTHKTILFADDDPDLLRLLVAKCKSISPNIEVVYARNAMTALTTTNVLRPDMVCIDVNMPRGNGMAVCEMIANHAELKDIPIVVLTGKEDSEIKERCRQISAHHVAKSGAIWPTLEKLIKSNLLQNEKPVVKKTLAPPNAPSESPQTGVEAAEEDLSVEEFLNALDMRSEMESGFEPPSTEPRKPSVLIIDDDPAWGGLLRRRFESKGVQVYHSLEGLNGFREAIQQDLMAIILDYEMQDVQGDYVLGRLKDNPITREIPVIVVTGHVNNALKRKVLNLGAAAFLNKPCSWDRLWSEMQLRTEVCV
ncbi:response regulator [Rhodopirellula sp. MGV]|uniref:response regulator n=1 Tax=Rhodopirellula sp. MGV TaxID=2023130 RepID=UPI00130447E0|nr:response regulator [Rhodopirellula sp. MGV]